MTRLFMNVLGFLCGATAIVALIISLPFIIATVVLVIITFVLILLVAVCVAFAIECFDKGGM